MCGINAYYKVNILKQPHKVILTVRVDTAIININTVANSKALPRLDIEQSYGNGVKKDRCIKNSNKNGLGKNSSGPTAPRGPALGAKKTKSKKELFMIERVRSIKEAYQIIICP